MRWAGEVEFAAEVKVKEMKRKGLCKMSQLELTGTFCDSLLYIDFIA